MVGDTVFNRQYSANIERLLQQFGAVLADKCRQETQVGEQAFFDQIGSVEGQEVFGSFQDSPQMNTPNARRSVTLRQWEVGDFVDPFEKVKMLIDPQSTIVQNFVDALSRDKDITLIGRQTIGDATTVQGGFFGTAYTGKTGTTTVAFPSANQIAVDFSSTGTNSNLTINKLIECRRLMISFFNQPKREPWYVAITSSQLASLLKTTQVTNADYNTIKALVQGEIDSFLGYEFLDSEYLLTDGSGYRRLPVWAKSGMLCSTAININSWVDKRTDKRGSWYAYASMSCGVTRMQENKVLEIKCDETK